MKEYVMSEIDVLTLINGLIRQQESLAVMIDTLDKAKSPLVDQIRYEHFDIYGLVGLLKESEMISVLVKQSSLDNWSATKHNVDRPQWLDSLEDAGEIDPLDETYNASELFFESLSNLGYKGRKFESDFDNVAICELLDDDMIIYVSYDSEDFTIKGINYHMDCNDRTSETINHFKNPCVHLTEIFNRVKHRQTTLEDAIMRAIELYEIAFVDDEIFLDEVYTKRN